MSGFAARCALCLALAAGGAVGFSPRIAQAQSAADKATARQLATDGIKLYGAGKYAEALDMLQRAQSLYDAPVHLLYIARASVKVGKLVEAAEAYRRLERVQLEPGAPKAFKEAVAAADKELAEVEPRIPALRLDIEPAGVKGLEIRIDEETVPPAAVGIDRPANPGERKVAAWAPGYKKSEATIALGEGERKSLALKLLPGEGPAPAGMGAAGGGEGEGPPGGDQGVAGTAEPERPPAKIGFMVGLRVAGAIPSGTAYVNTAGDEVPMSDDFEAGGGGELHAGVRFMKYFTGLLFLEAYTLRPGSALDELPVDVSSVEVTSSPVVTGVGIGAMIGTERGRFGGFGEIGFLPIHNFEITRDISLPSGVSCTHTVRLAGNALRIGGGLSIPVADFLNLTPYMLATFGGFNEMTSDSDCPTSGSDAATAATVVDDFSKRHEIQDRAGHQLFILGVGGDFLIGRDKAN